MKPHPTLEELNKIMEKNGGHLDLRDTGITSLPEGLTVGGSLYLRDTGITSLPEGLTVGGSLYLSYTGITSLPEGLTVGGSLDLSYTGITSLPGGLTVGGYLDLSYTGITSLPEGLTVSESLYLSGTGITDTTNVKRLHNGDYVEGRYLYADNILTHVKSARKKGRYTLYIGKVKGRNVIYDGVNYAHCDKWRDGIADLSFKAAKNRGAEQYRNLTADSVIKKDDAIAMYRVITGACQQGTQNFLDNLPELKEEYKVSEIIELTKGQYGSDTFVRFFGGVRRSDMNREILFRGKHDGEWIEGFYKAEGYDTYRGCIDRTPYIQQLGKCVSWAVDPSTVGQYTGLTDRNGVRIFEGDILEHDSGAFHEVVFEQRNGNAYFGWVINENETWHFDSEFLRQLQVIGNIHDNPEMLKGEK